MRFIFGGLVAAITASTALAADPSEVLKQNSDGEIVFRDYPPRALDAAEHGKVGFHVRTDDKGYALSCEVTKSSGFPMLDNDTCRLLMVHATFKPVGGGAGIVNKGVVNWTIDPWLLEAKRPDVERRKPTPRFGWSKKARLPDRVEIATADGSRQICKRVPRTGSLAGFERICRSKQDWEKTSEANGIYADMQGRNGISPRN